MSYAHEFYGNRLFDQSAASAVGHEMISGIRNARTKTDRMERIQRARTHTMRMRRDGYDPTEIEETLEDVVRRYEGFTPQDHRSRIERTPGRRSIGFLAGLFRRRG